jgi:hypothetical protein
VNDRDTTDAWWHAQETDERWRRHIELRAELQVIVNENQTKTKKHTTKNSFYVDDKEKRI